MTTQPTHPLPFPRSYWVVPGRLLAGCYPGDLNPAVAAKKLDALLACGVGYIVNLMQPDERDHAGRPFAPYDDLRFRLCIRHDLPCHTSLSPISDLGVPDEVLMSCILHSMDDALARGHIVYVHCWGGRGRTGTVIGCWLARHGETDPLQRLQQLTADARQHFPKVPETAQQQAFVRNWRIGQ